MYNLLYSLFLLHSLLSFVMPITSSIYAPVNCPEGAIPFGADVCVDKKEAFVNAMTFLEKNLPSWDITNKVTLGFPSAGSKVTVDGLNSGVANTGTNLTLETKPLYPWSASVPLDIFNEYVLPYASVNEGRSDWRQLLLPVVQSILTASGRDINSMNTSDVVYAVNAALWSGPLGKSIIFKSSQTPLIYDPMSTLAFGYASCTGVSLFFLDALRSVGVAARLAGTPAWNSVASNGNHNWIEVWSPEQEWQFIEAAPAGT